MLGGGTKFCTVLIDVRLFIDTIISQRLKICDFLLIFFVKSRKSDCFLQNTGGLAPRARCYRMFKPILGDLNFKLFAVRIVF